jgi:hypothetical protein
VLIKVCPRVFNILSHLTSSEKLKKRPLEKLSPRWENNIKKELKETGDST